jgi:DNA-binding CsgD family transcriptional regulator
MPTHRSTELLIDRIYEAAVLPELWQSVLGSLTDIAEAKGALLLTADPRRDGRWIGTPGTAAWFEVFSHGDWPSRNSRAAKLAAMHYPGFVCDLDLFTTEEMDRDPFYTELLRPLGLGWGAGTLIESPAGDTLIVTIEGAQPVRRERVHILDELRPHLARAALMSARLQLERARTSIEVLEKLGLPAAVVDDQGRVKGVNGLFDNDAPCLGIGAWDKLRLANAAANELLTQGLSRLRTIGAMEAPLSIPVPAMDGRRPAVVHLLPIKRQANDIFVRALGIVMVTELTPAVSPSTALLDGLFDLAPAEARLAGLIASGLPLRTSAQKLGITEETARTVLKRVFAKVGVSRQAELVALLGRLAPAKAVRNGTPVE